MTLAEAKQNLRLSPADTTHDDDVTDSIDAAVEQVEQDCDRCIIDQSFQLWMDCFPSGARSIQLSQKPIQSITSIEYLDTDAATQTLDPATYALDAGRRQIYLLNGEEWPTALVQQNTVTLTYVCGYGTTAGEGPRLFKKAVLLLVGKWFYDPADQATGSNNYGSAYGSIIERLLRTSYP